MLLSADAAPTHALALRAVALLVAPLQELAEQRLPLLLREAADGRPLVLQEARELAAHRLRVGHLFLAQALEHLLGEAPAGPARNRRRKIDVAPFRMPLRLAKLVPFVEQALGEPFNATVAVAALRPI